jgi:hypothetical protein
MPARPFGGTDAYYSRLKGRTNPGLPSVLEGILLTSAKEETERARRNWNQQLREALRDETGFRSSQSAASASRFDTLARVKVDVVDGVAEPLVSITLAHPDPIAWWLLLNRRKLQDAADSLNALDQRASEIMHSSLASQMLEGDPGAVVRSRDLIERLLAGEIDKPIVERMRTIERDWLGAYFFRQGRIELYAPAIALWSEYCGVPIEDMAIVVLAHELAHAVTHMGRDMDGRVWATNDFVAATTFLVEGLAQFYTNRVCDRLMDRRPAVRTAFDLLNKNQAPPYQEFQRWTKIGPLVGEAVRQALIDCRVARVKDHNAFYALVETAHARLAAGEAPLVDEDEDELF